MISNVTLLLTSDDSANSSPPAKKCPALHNPRVALRALLRHGQSLTQLYKLVHFDRGDFPTALGAEMQRIRALDP